MEKALYVVFYNELSNNNTASTEVTDYFTADCLINAFLKVGTEESEVEMKNALNDAKRAEGGKDEEGGDIEIEVAAARKWLPRRPMSDRQPQKKTKSMKNI